MLLPVRVKFTVADYYKMIEHGILLENPREEIIDGALYQMPSATALRAALQSKLSEIFYSHPDDKFSRVFINRPITLDEYNEPIPDFCFLKSDKKEFRERHPKADEVNLILETSDQTLDFDRDVKIPLYALARIPEVWIINLVRDEIEMYSEPNGKMYNSVKTVQRGEIVKSEVLPEIVLKVDEILF